MAGYYREPYLEELKRDLEKHANLLAGDVSAKVQDVRLNLNIDGEPKRDPQVRDVVMRTRTSRTTIEIEWGGEDGHFMRSSQFDKW